jgi:hypothetical protein
MTHLNLRDIKANFLQAIQKSTTLACVVTGLIVLGILVAFPYYVYNRRDLVTYVLLGSFSLAIGWTIYANRNEMPWRPQLANIKKTLPLSILRIILIAFILRSISLSLFPLPDQPAFEELEVGANAFNTLRIGFQPLEFRFTNLIAWLGWWLSGDVSLTALRFPFQLGGYLSLILLIICLRDLQIGWQAVIVVTFIAATLRLLVIASGSADELFASLPFALLLIWFVIRIERSEHNAVGWAGLAGIVGGILMHEYISYRAISLLGIAVSFRRAWQLHKQTNGINRNRSPFLIPYAFCLTLIIIALPMLLDMIYRPARSSFLEGVRRHLSERNHLLAIDTAFNSLRSYVVGLSGFGTGSSPIFAPPNESLIPTPIGCIFLTSILTVLIWPRYVLVRAFAVISILTLIVACILANNNNTGRLVAVMPFVLITTACFFDSLYKWLAHKIALLNHSRYKPASIQTGLNFVLILLIIYISTINLFSIQRMAYNQEVRIDLAYNDLDDFALCQYLANETQPYQTVFLYSFTDDKGCIPEQPFTKWIYADKKLNILVVEDFPTAAELPPQTLVIASVRARSLTEDEMNIITSLALETNSLDSLQTGTNVAGETPIASICYQCR